MLPQKLGFFLDLDRKLSGRRDHQRVWRAARLTLSVSSTEEAREDRDEKGCSIVE